MSLGYHQKMFPRQSLQYKNVNIQIPWLQPCIINVYPFKLEFNEWTKRKSKQKCAANIFLPI